MKYIIVILLAISLTACGGAVSTAEATEVAPPAPAPAPPPPPPPIATPPPEPPVEAPVSVLQADLSAVGSACTVEGSTVPGLTLTVDVPDDAQPVKISYFVNFRASPKGSIHLSPVINDTRQVDQQITRAIGDFQDSGQTDVLGYSRVYWLDSGQYQLAIFATCQSSIMFLRGTLTVELL